MMTRSGGGRPTPSRARRFASLATRKRFFFRLDLLGTMKLLSARRVS